jgi:hypothetical protein
MVRDIVNVVACSVFGEMSQPDNEYGYMQQGTDVALLASHLEEITVWSVGHCGKLTDKVYSMISPHVVIFNVYRPPLPY